MADIEKDETMAAAGETAATETEAVAESAVTEEAVPASEKKKEKKKESKPNFFVRLGRRLAKFWRDYNSERKKISWKPWREVCKSAGVVVVTVAIFSLVIWGLDQAFGALFAWLANLI